MPTFYCAQEPGDYRHREFAVVVATSMEQAAHDHASDLFDTGDYDEMTPIEVIVAEDENGKNATEYKVGRNVVITHHTRSSRKVVIPKVDD